MPLVKVYYWHIPLLKSTYLAHLKLPILTQLQKPCANNAFTERIQRELRVWPRATLTAGVGVGGREGRAVNRLTKVFNNQLKQGKRNCVSKKDGKCGFRNFA